MQELAVDAAGNLIETHVARRLEVSTRTPNQAHCKIDCGNNRPKVQK
jgi:hypothetical protein